MHLHSGAILQAAMLVDKSADPLKLQLEDENAPLRKETPSWTSPFWVPPSFSQEYTFLVVFFLHLSTQTHSANKNQQILVDGQWRMHPIKTIGMVLDQFIGIFTTNSMRFKLTVLFLVGGHLILEKVTVRSLNHPKKVTKNCQIAFEMVPFQVTFVHFQGGWG